jgi:putative endonuclease
MLLCDQKTFYIGYTNNIKNRLHQHQSKQSFYTKRFSDFVLVHCEHYNTEDGALMRERQLKGWSHTKKQRLVTGELGINVCTEVIEALLRVDRNM